MATAKRLAPSPLETRNGSRDRVIEFPGALDARPPRTAALGLGLVAVAQALMFGLSVFFDTYYDFSIWGLLSVGSFAAVIGLLFVSRPVLGRQARLVLAGLALLAATSASSLLWAESREAAWTEFNRLSFYIVTLVIVVLAVRQAREARLIVFIFGCTALGAACWVCGSLLVGDVRHLFVEARLNQPVGYINGVAGLLVMGIWPWVAFAEGARSQSTRATSVAASVLIANVLVLTQSRAVVPALIASVAIVLLCGGSRGQRAVTLLLVGAGVAVALPWTLDVYTNGHAHGGTPVADVASAAALAAIASSILAGLLYVPLRALTTAWSTRSTRAGRRIAAAGVGVALTSLLLFAAPAAAPWASRQYDAFVDLRVDKNSPSRFVDVGGFRYDLWRIAVKEFAAQPFTGIGAGNYDVEYYRRRGNPQSVRQPHSLELQILAELGIFGAIGLGVALIGSFWAIVRPKGLIAARDRTVVLASAGIFVAWLAHTSVDWLYNLPGLTGMAFMSLGLLLVSRESRHSTGTVGSRFLVLALVVVLALLAASTGRQYAAMLYRDDGSAQVAGSPTNALRTLRVSETLDPYAVSTRYAKAAAYARANDYARSRDELLAAARLEPHNYVPWALLGDLQVRRGELSSARLAYRHASALNPLDAGLALLARDPREALTRR